MKKFTYGLLLLAAMMVGTIEAKAQETRAIHFQTWYGDNMGVASEDTPTKKIEYLYGPNNELLRKIQTGLMTESDDWMLTNYYRFDYNEKGQLERTNSLQYGVYDQGEYAFKAAKDTVDYEYNELGQVSKEIDRAKLIYYVYEYDNEGRMVKNARWKYDTYGTKTYKNDLTIEYSDFTLGGPQTLVCTATSSYNNYDGKITYDEAGNKTSEKHWSPGEEPVLKQAEYWTYENGVLALYEKKAISNGEEIDGTKIVYEQIDADNTRATTYSYGNGKWNQKGGTTTVTTYDTFNAEYNRTNLTAEQDATDDTSVNLSFDLPVGYYMYGDMQFRVYRDGLLLAEKGLLEMMSGGLLKYTDTKVSNGVHEYFVQVMIPSYSYTDSGYAKTWAGRNISNVAAINLQKELPHASNLHAVKATKNADGIYTVTVEWDNPTFTDDMNFVATHIMKQGRSWPMADISDPTVTTADVDFDIDPVTTIYVQTQYASGRFDSETVTIDADKFLTDIEEINKCIRVEETWGDAMGVESGVCTKKTITYYGNDDRVQRVGHYGKTVGSDEWTLTEYETYEYNEGEMLEKSYSERYGLYDYGDFGFEAARDTTYYEYNLEGQRLKEYNLKGLTIEYEYTNDGSLAVWHSVDTSANPALEQTITYSDFAGKDKPRYTESTGNLNSYKWTLETEYDANGRVSQTRSTKYSSGEYKPNKLEIFEYYEDGSLKADSVFNIKVNNDVETYVIYTVTTYEPEADNANRVVVKKYVWDSILGKFGNPKTWNVIEYAEINAKRYAPTLTVESVENEINTVRLNVEVPLSLQNGMTVFNVYRDGIEIGHALDYFNSEYYTTDEYGNNGKWSFVDHRVKNGACDYFVEYAKLDNTMDHEAQINNISNVVVCNFDYALPKATGLAEVSRRETTTENTDEDTGETTLERNVFVTLEWQAPEVLDGLEFKRYNVMLTGVQVADNSEEEGQETTYELAMRGQEELNVYIQCVYDLGRSNGDTITIKENLIDGVHNVISGTKTSFVLNGKVITLSDAADVSLFSADGHLLVRGNTNRLDLSDRPSGVYLLVIVKNGRQTVAKVRM